MKTTLNFTYDKVAFNKDTNDHLVIVLKAPEQDQQKKRPKICIVPVIDVSHSMGGDPLHYAKQSAIKIVEHLQVGDYFGLVTFASDVQETVPLAQVTAESKQKWIQQIGDLYCRGSTNFSGGMLTALDMVEKMDLAAGTISRVIMLTDGQPNQGVAVTPNDIIRVFSANKGRSTLSAFGFGQHADQVMLGELSSAGQGNYAFIEDPDKALNAFGKELGGLLSTYAHNVKVTVTPNNGHELLDVLSDVDCKETDKGVTVTIPELLSEERREIVIEMLLHKQNKALPREMSVVDVEFSYEFLADDGKMIKEGHAIKGKVMFVKPKEAQSKPTSSVDMAVARAQAIAAQIEAESQAKVGNFDAASGILRSASMNFNDRGYGNLVTFISNGAQNMKDAATYAANASYFTSTTTGGTRSMGVSGTTDANITATALLYNSALEGDDLFVPVSSTQAATMASFTDGSSDKNGTTSDKVILSESYASNLQRDHENKSKKKQKKKSDRW